MINLRLTSIGELQLLGCIEHELWGSSLPRFKRWAVGDHLAFVVGHSLAAVATISGEPFESSKALWETPLLFPHRIPLRFTHALERQNRPPFPGIFAGEIGPNWGLVVLNKVPLPESVGKAILTSVLSIPSDLEVIRRDMPKLMEQARQLRDQEEQEEQ